jgi:hypothetical protein
MEAPSYLLPRPPFDLFPEKRDTFEELYRSTPAEDFTDYQLIYPKWQYLSYICEKNDLVLHGSQNLGISEVEPRRAKDVKEFSNRRAIYATTDGIWVIYFAILDRKKYPEMSLFNSCLQARISPDRFSEPMYFFSISHSVLVQKPWTTGAIYVLPRQFFTREPPQQVKGTEIVFPHWIGSQSVQPVAKLLVESRDFPFLEQIHGHNDEKLMQLASVNPGGFPWLDALES